ncbi:hypothetical protein EUGRSUZ_J00887 [Eucalyptus grandis]|uniref:Uncharacterized protein n=2 Tax=Eucalyptus grandis TaxID=71139 RepID=A0ACC3J3K0_EUCGR|nr:hypothetical protein EUGRSUZ_J00887 [Eucalyptus grandis]
MVLMAHMHGTYFEPNQWNSLNLQCNILSTLVLISSDKDKRFNIKGHCLFLSLSSEKVTRICSKNSVLKWRSKRQER